MEQVKISSSEIIFYLTIINIVLGILFGSLPLIAGFVLKNRKYGLYGFVISAVGGAVLGVLLAYPIAAVFTWLIVKNSKAETIAHENSADVSSKNSAVETFDSNVPQVAENSGSRAAAATEDDSDAL